MPREVHGTSYEGFLTVKLNLSLSFRYLGPTINLQEIWGLQNKLNDTARKQSTHTDCGSVYRQRLPFLLYVTACRKGATVE